MNPVAKTLLLTMGTILAVFAVPAVLIVFHTYLNAFFAIVPVLTCVVLFGYYMYQELLPEFQQAQLEEEQIMARFAGNPEKIRFYRGFKKHFDGDLDLTQLRQWLIDHPRKH
jgi:purine-cytosine permease-like protein